MPLYEYVCSRCQKLFEIIVPLDKYGKKIRCPHCRKQLKKIMSPVMFKI